MGNKSMLIIMIAVMVVLVGVVVGALLYIINLVGKSSAAVEGENVPTATHTAEHVTMEETLVFKLADSISVNLLDSNDGSKHVFRVAIAVGVDGRDAKKSTPLMETLAVHEFTVRDAIIGILRTKTLEDIQKADGLTVVKQEILTKLQELFETNLIIDVSNGEFYYQ